MAADDLEKYVVVRAADEIVIDLMKSACGIAYEDARGMVDEVEIDGVAIPFANARLLWRTKNAVRDKPDPRAGRSRRPPRLRQAVTVAGAQDSSAML